MAGPLSQTTRSSCEGGYSRSQQTSPLIAMLHSTWQKAWPEAVTPLWVQACFPQGMKLVTSAVLLKELLRWWWVFTPLPDHLCGLKTLQAWGLLLGYRAYKRHPAPKKRHLPNYLCGERLCRLGSLLSCWMPFVRLARPQKGLLKTGGRLYTQDIHVSAVPCTGVYAPPRLRLCCVTKCTVQA